MLPPPQQDVCIYLFINQESPEKEIKQNLVIREKHVRRILPFCRTLVACLHTVPPYIWPKSLGSLQQRKNAGGGWSSGSFPAYSPGISKLFLHNCRVTALNVAADAKVPYQRHAHQLCTVYKWDSTYFYRHAETTCQRTCRFCSSIRARHRIRWWWYSWDIIA